MAFAACAALPRIVPKIILFVALIAMIKGTVLILE
jgi:hypothetical protein